MKTLIEPFTATAGWSDAGGLAPWGVCEHPEFLADNMAGAVIFNCPAGSMGVGSEKTVAITLPSGYDRVVFHAWSRGKKRGTEFLKAADFAYSLDFGGADEWGIPIWNGFTGVSIGIDSLDISKILITPLHDDEDYLLLSAMYGVREEQPLDLMTGIQTGIQAVVDELVTDQVAVGTITTVAGRDYIEFAAAVPWIDRYSVIKIEGGGNSEQHQIEAQDERKYTLMSTYDGRTMLNPYTDADVTIAFPVVIGRADQEIAVPGISIWTMAPSPLLRQSGITRILDSRNLTTSEAKERREDQNLEFTVMIDCEARHHELLAGAAEVVRRFLGTNRIWVNGRRYNFEWTEPAQYVEPPTPVEMLPKVQYTLTVEAKEMREAPVIRQNAGAATLSFSMEVS